MTALSILFHRKVYLGAVKSYAIKHFRSYLACNKNKKGS